MSGTSTLPVGWVGKPETHTVPGAFRVLRSYDLTTNWLSVAPIRSMAADADVVELVALAGLDGADVAARAILKRVVVQNLAESEDAQVSEVATPGGSADPDPASAYLTAQSNGGVITLDCSTIMQRTDVQVRMASGTGAASVSIWFDVPQAIR